MERDEVYELIDFVKQNYSNISVSETEVDRHFEHLSDMPLDIALHNVRMHVKASVYPPKIAEIRNGWSDPVDHMAKAAREHIDAQEERRKHAVPPPQEVRDQIAAIRRSMDAKQSGS